MVAMCSFQVSLWSKMRPRNLLEEWDSNEFHRDIEGVQLLCGSG